MKALEQQQAQELLTIPLPFDPNSLNGNSLQHMAASAPTTPPRVNAALNDEHHSVRFSAYQPPMDADILSKAVGSAADKRKSVTYATSVNHSPELGPGASTNGFSRPAGAKSMPASRRTSASEHDEDLAGHLQGLSLAGERSTRGSPAPGISPQSILTKASRYGNDESLRYGNGFNAGMMLDEQLDQEMHSASSCNPLSPFTGTS